MLNSWRRTTGAYATASNWAEIMPPDVQPQAPGPSAGPEPDGRVRDHLKSVGRPIGKSALATMVIFPRAWPSAFPKYLARIPRLPGAPARHLFRLLPGATGPGRLYALLPREPTMPRPVCRPTRRRYTSSLGLVVPPSSQPGSAGPAVTTVMAIHLRSVKRDSR